MPEGTVAVTGLGLVTPAGIGVEENWRRVCSGQSMARADFAVPGMGVQLCCRVPDFDPVALLGARDARRLDRFTQLAVVAAREAVLDAGLALDDRPRVGIVMGSAVGGMASLEAQHRKLLHDGPDSVSPLLLPMFLPNMLAAQIAIDLGSTGPNLVVSTACASGATAIGVGRQLLLSDACDVVVAGGSEAALTPLIVTAFSRMRALSKRVDEPHLASRPFDAGRDGFVIGEGAAAVVLERPADARQRDARIRANLVGFAASEDAHHVTDPDPTGRGAEQAVRGALADAGALVTDVAHVNAHGTSTRLNDEVEARVLHNVFGAIPAVTSTKGAIGHTLAAAGAVEAAYTVLAVQNGVVPPTANLERTDVDVDIDLVMDKPRQQPVRLAMSTSFGFGGQNAALVFGTA